MNKKIITIVILCLAFCSFSFFVIMNSVAKEKKIDEVVNSEIKEPRVEINNIIIPVDLADTPESRQLGLSYREKMDDDRGMLFVMPNRAISSFWMKDMNFPLDIVWIDGDKIVKISANAPVGGPNPSATYSSDFPVDYVLEVNADFCKTNNIKVGDKVNIIISD